MIEPGLNQGEVERLKRAGFSDGVIAAIEAEARTMRFLWLRRLGIGIQSGIAIAFGGAFLANSFGLPDGWAAVVTFLFPVVLIGLSFAPMLEVQSVKSQDKNRWAARELAVLTVKANPDDDDNDEWQRLASLAQVTPPMASASAGLQAVAQALEDVSVAAQMARARAQEDAKTSQPDTSRAAQPHPAPAPSKTSAPARQSSRPEPKPRKNPAPSRADKAPARSMTPSDRDRRDDAIRGAIIVAALIALVVLILIQQALGR